MQESTRYITKIAREASKFTIRKMKEEGVGTGEFDFIHLVRHHPGITQAEIREELKIDKGAAARRAANLEAKGYLVRKDDPDDQRKKRMYPTALAEELRNSKAFYEGAFYEWLFAELSLEDQEEFHRILTQLYDRSKTESRSGFSHINVTEDAD